MPLSFLKDFKKDLSKMETITTDFSSPRQWYSTGNLSLNRLISGSFKKGIPQGRITTLAGVSGGGKSFLASNIVANAQKEHDAFIFVLDSENALDVSYLSKIGVDTSEDQFLYAGVTTIEETVKVLSSFIGDYEKEYGIGNFTSAPPVIILLDSLDMLISETENQHFEKGEQKGDQGGRSKKFKAMLRTVVSRIKRNPMAFIVTHQVYPNQDILNGQGPWIVNNAIRYSASQILLVSPLKLKEDGVVKGIRMRVETYKSRFSQVGTRTEIEIPYTEGINKYSGLIPLLEADGVVTSSGAWKSVTFNDGETRKFQMKQLDDSLVNDILTKTKIADDEKSALEALDLVNKISDESV